MKSAGVHYVDCRGGMAAWRLRPGRDEAVSNWLSRAGELHAGINRGQPYGRSDP